MKLRVVYDCTVLKENERVETDSSQSQSSPETSVPQTSVERMRRPSSIRSRARSSRADELLMSDVRSALEQGRPWDDSDDHSILTVTAADEGRSVNSRRRSMSVASLDDLDVPRGDDIVRGLEEMIGDGMTDDEAEERGEELSREIELALEGVRRSGSMPDGLEFIATASDGRRLVRSNRGGAVFEIETTTTVERMKTTTRVRAVSGGSMMQAFRGEAREETMVDQDEWVEVGSSSGTPQVANGMRMGAASCGALARQDTINNPREGGQKLQVGGKNHSSIVLATLAAVFTLIVLSLCSGPSLKS
jgi:hypothetical protein